MAVQESTKTTDGLTLLVQGETTDNPTVPVRWCISPQLFEGLKDRRVKDPQMLLVVWNSARQYKEFHLVPLDQMMHYVPLRCPGVNTIHATVVWDGEGKISRLWKRISDFQPLINPYSGELVLTGFTFSRCLGRALVNVQVAAQFFAKKPPKWLWEWVNFWFESAPKDECQFRKRALLAFTLQPIVLAIYYPFKSLICALVALWYLIWTKPKVDLRTIVMPWRHSLIDVYWDSRGKKPIFFQRFLWPLVPGFLLIQFILISVGNALHTQGHSWLPNNWLFWLAGIVLAEYAITLTGLGLAAFCRIAESWFESFRDWAYRQQEKRAERKEPKPVQPQTSKWELKCQKKEAERQRRLAEFEVQYQSLLCTTGIEAPLEPKLEALPPKQKTIYLRFLDLKARVCRPFPKGW